MSDNTTIAAISTPYGKGGVALIRVSGSDAASIADKVFFPASGKTVSALPHAKEVHGSIVSGGETIDDGMAVYFHAPHSYTGEDTVEITCHGGILLTQTVLEALFCAGAEQAGPGEFTRRAFLGGKLSLSQAEAVISLIDAESKEKLRLSTAQVRGTLRKRADALYDTVRTIVSSTYAYIDFPDEDMTDMSTDDMLRSLRAVREELRRLRATYRTGRAICEGIPTAIVGRPNTGKSSLLNAILGEQRAIVTPIAGTTRDTIEETATVGRVLLRLCDTAGIHETSDTVEQLGVARSVQKLRDAELILAVFDGSEALTISDRSLLEQISADKHGMAIAILNKCDLGTADGFVFPEGMFERVLTLSCETGEGMDALAETIDALFVDGTLDYDNSAVLTNARQTANVAHAEECISRAIDTLEAGMTQDLAGLDLEEALVHLGELDGRQVTEEIVNDIFHRFCVGK